MWCNAFGVFGLGFNSPHLHQMDITWTPTFLKAALPYWCGCDVKTEPEGQGKKYLDPRAFLYIGFHGYPSERDGMPTLNCSILFGLFNACRHFTVNFTCLVPRLRSWVSSWFEQCQILPLLVGAVIVIDLAGFHLPRFPFWCFHTEKGEHSFTDLEKPTITRKK